MQSDNSVFSIFIEVKTSIGGFGWRVNSRVVIDMLNACENCLTPDFAYHSVRSETLAGLIILVTEPRIVTRITTSKAGNAVAARGAKLV